MLAREFVAIVRFDSKLVRLKVGFLVDCCPSGLRFDSKLVRLKEVLSNADNALFECFDSKLVRLKGSLKAIKILYKNLMARVN